MQFWDQPEAVERAGEAATYAAAGTSLVLWGFSVSELAVLISASVAMASFGLHLWATTRRDRRETAAHKRAMGGTNADTEADEGSAPGDA